MNYPVWMYPLFVARFVYSQVPILTPVESNSSPSQIIATKGSSVLLYWNYTYIGDGRHDSVILTYKEQIIEFNEILDTTKVLAKRFGQNGVLTLQSQVPAPFEGRVEVISENNTLVIHNLQYYDIFYQFSSYVKVDADIGAGPKSNTFRLLPNVKISVYGTPAYLKEPPRTLDVNESSNLLLEVHVAGNPQPIQSFKWSHLHKEWSSIFPSFQTFTYLYTAKYKLNNIDGSYCGRTVHFELKNALGSVKKSTTVTVLLKLDRPFDLIARKIPASKCVEVKWKKVISGACNVRYAVALKGAHGKVLYNKTTENTGKRRICDKSAYAKSTDVQLTISFKGASKVVKAKLSEGQNIVSTPTTSAVVFTQVPILSPNKAKSSPSHMLATKGSSIWLHWNYTYFGDGMHGLIRYKFKEQIIGFHTPSKNITQIIAKRIGQNGALVLESSVPAPFKGRVEVISSNSTVIIHNLQYNDSKYKFSSSVTVDANSGAGPKPNTFPIPHLVKITVHGAPQFIRQPPRNLVVTEGSNLWLNFSMDGNPKPSAYFKWSHLGQVWSEIASLVKLYPFVYVGSYKLDNIDGGYCGRTLLIEISNNIGLPSLSSSTYVTVKLRLDRFFDLKARKIASNCVEVTWKRLDPGACSVKHALALLGANGKVFYNKTEENIGKRKVCSISNDAKITDAQLTVSFNGISKVLTAKVYEEKFAASDHITTAAIDLSKKHKSGDEMPVLKQTSHGNPTSSARHFKTSHESSSYTGFTFAISIGAPLVVFAIIIGIYVCIRKSQRRRRNNNSRDQVAYIRNETDKDDDQVRLRVNENQHEDEIPPGQWLLSIKDAMVGLIRRRNKQQ